MNFITKNLGWILLLLFFIFMLFIISSNDPQRVNLTGTGDTNTGTTLSGETDKNLDDLIKLIDSEKINEAEVGEEETQEPNDQEEVSQDDEEEKGFFAKLFGRDDEDEEIIENQEDTTKIGSKVNEDVSQINTNTNSYVSQSESNQISNTANIIKSTSNTQQEIYTDTIITYPGTDLITAVGNTYEIGVGMLKLNNKSFNTTLGYMKKGVVVKQLTKENSYGCFQIRVVSTGSIGYVCKKYLTNVSVSIPKDTSETTIQEDTIIPVVFTAIGSYYKIAMESPAFFDDSFERFTLAKGDFLRQVSHGDSKTGCVGMKVIGTSTEEHDGKIIDICSADLVVAVK